MTSRAAVGRPHETAPGPQILISYLPREVEGDEGCGHEGPVEPIPFNREWLARDGYFDETRRVLVPKVDALHQGPHVGPLAPHPDDLQNRFRKLITAGRLATEPPRGRGRIERRAKMGQRALIKPTRIENSPYDEHTDPFFADLRSLLDSNHLRRLRGVMQVYPRTVSRRQGVRGDVANRLSHGWDAAEVGISIALAIGANPYLTLAAALGHDLGHLPGGHAGEVGAGRLWPRLTQPPVDRFDHAHHGGDRAAELGLQPEVVEGIRLHSWSMPYGTTWESSIVSISDRIAYVASDITDLLRLQLVESGPVLDWNKAWSAIPHTFEFIGMTKMQFDKLESSLNAEDQLAREIRAAFVNDVIATMYGTGHLGFSTGAQTALVELRTFVAYYTFQNPRHKEWQAHLSDYAERLIEIYANSASRQGLEPDDALLDGLAHVSRMSEHSFFREVVNRGVDDSERVKAVLRGPDLTPPRLTIVPRDISDPGMSPLPSGRGPAGNDPPSFQPGSGLCREIGL